jgi:hypothetical protein
VNPAIRGADAVRLVLWRQLGRTRLGRACARDRQTRGVTLATVHIAVALVLTLVAPLWLLLVGPLILGVPHVASGLRFLGARRYGGPGLGWMLRLAVPLLALTGLRILATVGGPDLPTAELALGLTALAAATFWSGGTPARCGLGMVLIVTLGALLWSHARLTAVVIGHIHNFMAVILWVALAASASRRARAGVAAAFVVGLALLLSGVLEPISGLTAPIAGFDMHQMVQTLAPGLDPIFGFRLVLAFAFAQAVHYSMWLRVTPISVGDGAVAPSFARATRNLFRDLGRPVVIALVALILGLTLFALFDPAGTRRLYLSAVLFHGWFELAIAARLLARL